MRLIVILAALGLGVASPGRAQPDAAATARLITELGLREAPEPARAHPRWRRPQRVVVLFGTPEQAASLQSVAPGVEIIAPGSFSDARAALATADAYLGPCIGSLLRDVGPNLVWVHAFSAGVEDCVAAPAFRQRDVVLTNMQRVSGVPMAEHVMALTLAHARRLPTYVDAQRRGVWSSTETDIAPPTPLARAFTLVGKTMLVVGFGGVGSEVAKRAHAMGMTVHVIRNSRGDAPPYVHRMGVSSDLAAWVATADIVVDTLPLTTETRGLFNARIFGAMKPGAFFVNVGRGGTVVTDDLVEALRAGRLSGAGLDVVQPEPLPPGHPLWTMPGVVITPHVSADSDDETETRWQVLRENLRRYVAGDRLLSVVDPARGY